MYPKEADQGDGPVHTSDRPRRSPKQYSRFANFYTTHKKHAKRRKTKIRPVASPIAKFVCSANRSQHALTANSATNNLCHSTRIRKMAINLEDHTDSSGTGDEDIMAVEPQTSEYEQIIEQGYLGGKIGGGGGARAEITGSEDAEGENSKTGHTRKRGLDGSKGSGGDGPVHTSDGLRTSPKRYSRFSMFHELHEKHAEQRKTNTRTAASQIAKMSCFKNGPDQALTADVVAPQTSKDEQRIERECLGGREIDGSEGAGGEKCGSKGAGGESSKTCCIKKRISDVELECVPNNRGMEKTNPGDKYETITEALLQSMNARKELDFAKSERYKAHSSDEYSIRECMDALNKLPGVSTTSYNKALQFLVSLDWRKIFLHMPDDRKIGWLNDLK